MANLGKFGALRAKFSGLADFVTVYISEAHPSERGHFTDNIDIATHQSMDDRITAAWTLKKKAGNALEGCPILVDPMDDRANIAYGAHPERLYVVKDGIVVFEGGLGPFDYSTEEVEKFLSKIA